MVLKHREQVKRTKKKVQVMSVTRNRLLGHIKGRARKIAKLAFDRSKPSTNVERTPLFLGTGHH